MTMVARIPRITTTMSSSMSVKPDRAQRCRRDDAPRVIPHHPETRRGRPTKRAHDLGLARRRVYICYPRAYSHIRAKTGHSVLRRARVPPLIKQGRRVTNPPASHLRQTTLVV